MKFINKMLEFLFKKSYDAGYDAAVKVSEIFKNENIATTKSITTSDIIEKRLILEHRARLHGFDSCAQCGRSTALKYARTPIEIPRGITLRNYNDRKICQDCWNAIHNQEGK